MAFASQARTPVIALGISLVAGCSAAPVATGFMGQGYRSSAQSANVTAALPLAKAETAAAGEPAVFVTIISTGVGVYAATGKRIGTIPFPHGLSYGLAVDSKRNLYVGTHGDRVDVLAPPYRDADNLLDAPQQGADELAVDRRGDLIAGSIYRAYSNYVFAIWKAGHAAPCRLLQSGTYGSFAGMAFDAEGNIFVSSGNTDGTSSVLEVSGGCKTSGFVPLLTTNSRTGFGDVKVNAVDQIVVSDNAYRLYTYAHPTGTSLGMPIATTILQKQLRAFAFTGDGKALWGMYYGPPKPGIHEFAYPAGGAPIATIDDSNSRANSLTVVPALIPRPASAANVGP